MWAAWTELPPDIGDVLRLLLLTGQRCSEVCGMTVEELRPNERLWVLPSDRGRTKNELAHSVPLSPTVWGLVEAAFARARSGYLFPARGADGPIAEHQSFRGNSC